MKRIFTLALAALMLFALAACGETQSAATPTPAATPDTVPVETPATTESPAATDDAGVADGSNILIAYFSWSGNTEAVAGMIQSEVGGDLFEIAPAEPYTEDYDELLDIARDEQSSGARPALADTVDNWDSYDKVFVGYPNWWSDAPMAVYTFLESYDWTGKTLVPFNTSASGGFGRSLDSVAESAPGATILEGFTVRSSALDGAQADVSAWLAGLGLA